MDYTELEIYGVPLRYYDEERIDKISRGKWKTIKQTTTLGVFNGRFIHLTGRAIRVERIVYKIHNPSWDIEDNSNENAINHLDNCKSNNKIDNLKVMDRTKGYSYNKQKKKYQAMIKRDGKSFHLGYFVKEEDARNAYLKAKAIYDTL